MLKKNDPIKVIEAGDLDRLKKLLTKKPDLIEKEYEWAMGRYGYSGILLAAAAFFNQPSIIRYLCCEKGMDVNCSDNWTPLHFSADSNAQQACAILLELGANPRSKNKNGKTPYDLATNQSLRASLNPDLKTIDAVQNGDLQALKAGIEKDPSLLNGKIVWNDGGYNGTLLHLAAFYNQPEIIDDLFRKKAVNIDDQNTPQRWAPLHHAAANNAMEAIIKLLHLGANPSLRTDGGNYAEKYSDDAEIKKFLKTYREEYEAAQKREQDKIKAAGEWTALTGNEIMHERTLPGDHYRLTRIFNFSSGLFTSITKDLESGQIIQTEKEFKNLGDQASIDEARVKLNDINALDADKNDGGTADLRAARKGLQKGSCAHLGSLKR